MVGGLGGAIFGGAAGGALGAAVTGGDPATGAIVGGISGGIMHGLGFEPLHLGDGRDQYINQLLASTTVNAGIGGTVAEVKGGDFATGASTL